MSARARLLTLFGAAAAPGALEGLSWDELIRRLVRWAESRAAADPTFARLWAAARHEEDCDLAARGWRPCFCPGPRGGVARYWCRPRAGGGQTGAAFRNN
jgi:hypothetical protein